MTSKLRLPLPESRAQRVLLAVVLSTLGLFLLGLTVGFAVAVMQHGHLPRRQWVAALVAAALPLGLISLVWAKRAVLEPTEGQSAYEKRYWKMWVIVMALGAPLGVIGVLPTLHEGRLINPLTEGALSPAMAIVAVLLFLALMIVAVVVYHRTIDEQEEQAYLWGSQVAFYALTLFFPAWWLLQKAALVPAMGIGIALLAILGSFIVQALVWAWLKFR